MADVLVVEDDDDVAEVLVLLLSDEGHKVRRASNGEEGLARLHEGPRPDLILLDVEMPILSGPGMAARILIHDAGLEEIPIVVVSAAYGLPVIAAAVGTPYYLAKPFDPDVLLSVIARALVERRPPNPSAMPPPAAYGR